MKKSILLVFIVSLLTSFQVLACTVSPLDQDKETDELRNLAFAALDINPQVVTFLEKTDATAKYIWTPMCPSHIKVKATFTIGHNNSSDPLSKGCTGVATVEKSIAMGKAKMEGEKNKITITIDQDVTCLE